MHRRLLAFALCGLVAAYAFAQPPAVPPPEPAGGIRVKLETLAGKSVEGRLERPTLAVETDFGSVVVNLAKVRTVDFSKGDDGAVEVVVELDDQSHVVGSTKAAEFRVDGTAYPASDVREIKVVKPHDASTLGLAIGLVTLTVMEVVLGVDNVIFLAITVGRLPPSQQPQARRFGLAAALGTRILLLFSLSFLLGLTKPVFELPVKAVGLNLAPDAREVSWRDMILLAGGVFLIYKSVREMHEKIEEARAGGHHDADGDGKADGPGRAPGRKPAGFWKTIALIAVIDIVFSLDSVITAVGMVESVPVMIAAMVAAMVVMLVFAGPIGRFVERFPTVKMLALAFLILIGVLLVAEGMGQHFNKGYVYFAMAFAVAIEFVNMTLRGKKPAPEAAVGASG